MSEADQGHIWDHVVSAMRDEERFPFRISRENVRTINGREEAYYAALSTNYIAKKIDSNLMYVKMRRCEEVSDCVIVFVVRGVVYMP